MELTVTKDNFETAIMAAKDVVLLDFWADWCGPCRMLAPVLEEIAHEYDGRVIVGKVNVDEQPELANAFSVQSIPMLVVMKDGRIVHQTVGFQEKNAVVKLLEL